MKVKIGNQVFDPNEQPIMFVFEDDESLHKTIENMAQMIEYNSKKYCIYPDNMNIKEIKKFMKNV